MPRPRLSDTRRPQILDAFSTCIARHGLEGTTLERIAEVAGMKRTILRHYIGNRDNLVIQAAERIQDRFVSWVDEHIEPAADARQVLSILFTINNDNLSELTLFARFTPDARVDLVRPFIAHGVAHLANVLARKLHQISTADRSTARSLAAGISSLCLAHQILGPLDLADHDQLVAAETLLRGGGIETEGKPENNFDDQVTEIGVND